MKRHKIHQVVPSLIMAGAAAVPVITTLEILTHVPSGGITAGLQPSAPVAVAPIRTSSNPAPSSVRGAQTYQGPVVNDPFGGVQATITVAGKKISNVVISTPQDNPRSAGINQQAVPLLQSETLQAQSAQISGVSGATLTSSAYAQSLQSALDQARSQGNAIAGAAASSQLAGNTSAGAPPAPSVSVSGDD
jgi:uncharacterized protein with FMN-binding domain